MNSKLYDIVILPSEDLKLKAIGLSKALQSENTLFTLDDIRIHPHASLYMALLRIEDIDSVTQLLSEIASKYKTVRLHATTYNQARGYIDIEYQTTSGLIDLKSTVVNAINPMRDGMQEEDKLQMKTATGLTLYNLQTYGYKYAGELFRPHISFTRFKNEGSVDTSTLPKPSEFNGTFTKLGLFEMGDNGTCIREIVTYSLGND